MFINRGCDGNTTDYLGCLESYLFTLFFMLFYSVTILTFAVSPCKHVIGNYILPVTGLGQFALHID